MSPDYPRYSLKELREALETIDKARYPERLEQIYCEITKRTVAANSNIPNSDIPPSSCENVMMGRRVFVFILGIIFICWGGYSAIEGEMVGKNRIYTKENDPFLFYFRVLICIGVGVILPYYAVVGKKNNHSSAHKK